MTDISGLLDRPDRPYIMPSAWENRRGFSVLDLRIVGGSSKLDMLAARDRELRRQNQAGPHNWPEPVLPTEDFGLIVDDELWTHDGRGFSNIKLHKKWLQVTVDEVLADPLYPGYWWLSGKVVNHDQLQYSPWERLIRWLHRRLYGGGDCYESDIKLDGLEYCASYNTSSRRGTLHLQLPDAP